MNNETETILMEEAAVVLDNNSAAYVAQQFNFTSALWSMQFGKTVFLLKSLKKRKRVRLYIKSRSLHYFKKTWPTLDEDQFKKMFRFDRDDFYLIVGTVESLMVTAPPPGLKNIVNRELPPYQQVAMALNRLVTGHCSESVGSQFGVSDITVRRCTVKFCKAVVKKLKPLFLKWPSVDERTVVKRQFQCIWGLPNCVGAIDCTHVNMECPQADLATDYCDRKGRFSIQVQAIVDANMKFLDINCGWAGSVHDSRIFSMSKVYDDRKDYFNGPKVNVNGIHVPEYLVGDTGYPMSPHMLIPVPGREATLKPEQRHFNFKQSSTRIVVERASGRLKTVF